MSISMGRDEFANSTSPIVGIYRIGIGNASVEDSMEHESGESSPSEFLLRMFAKPCGNTWYQLPLTMRDFDLT